MKGYTSVSNVEDYTGKTIAGTDDETIVESYITSAERYIDKKTNRNFIASEQTRYYSGMGKPKLFIDDAVELITVKRATDAYGDELVTLDADDYVVVPRDYSQRNEPIHVIYLRNDYWTTGQQNHEITAKFGYSESVPEDVELATTILVSILLNDSNSKDVKGVEREKIGEYSVTYSKDSSLADKFGRIDTLLSPYIDYIF